VLKMFTDSEIKVIDTSHNGIFNPIKRENEDKSFNIDVFDLYKSDIKDLYLVFERGEIRLKSNLQHCLDYIYRWL
jgi:hypothetical protein